MKHSIQVLIFIFFISAVGCKESTTSNSILVSDSTELEQAIKDASAGDVITMANGVWNDVEIKFVGTGTEDKPIKLKAETSGEVFIEGESCIKIGGEYLVVEGLHFRNGHTPSNAVIRFKKDNENLAQHCRVTECVVEDFNQPMRDKKDHWVEFWGRHNMLDHCYISGKANQGPTVRVFIKGNQSINNYHQIVANHFGPRPRKGGPRGETIQIGDSYTSMSPSYTNVADNLFEKCNGEVEVISSKTNFNTFTNNVFYKSEGSLVMRHGNYCRIDGNYFIGDETNNIGGVRIINTGHWVVNNYFYSLRGEGFRTPLAIMNGIPKSPLNRYNQVTDAVIAYNTWVNCESPWQFGIGSNVDQKDVLPLSEIRSARPARVVVANNVIHNEDGDAKVIVAHDSLDGIRFTNNFINNQGTKFRNYASLQSSSFDLNEVNEYIKVPYVKDNDSVYQGFDFETIETDILGNTRSNENRVGAFAKAQMTDPALLDKSKYGPSWYEQQAEDEAKKVVAVNNAEELAAALIDVAIPTAIELADGEYVLSESLQIDNDISIESKGNATITFEGGAETPLFQMRPKADLELKGIVINGNESNYCFATLKEGMSSHYNLKVADCALSNFNYVLKAYKQTMAQFITFEKCTISDCENGIELSEEINDKGDYNVEFLTIDGCSFKNVSSNVIDYYRGGYDESTIGGNLIVQNSSFESCGGKEKNGILLNHRGIINVNISSNEFVNNRVQLVSRLWGAKNNSESDNKVVNSGKLITEENLKLKMMY